MELPVELDLLEGVENGIITFRHTIKHLLPYYVTLKCGMWIVGTESEPA